MLKIIVIVGRENVGKSTLFNRLIGGRPAITHREPGITRDRNIKEVELFGVKATLIDTGGYLPNEDGIKAKVNEQVELSIKDAGLILFLVDAKSGLTPYDEEFADRLRKLDKRVILVVNKVDTKRRQYVAPEFHKLGFTEVVNLSAIHGLGINELTDKMIEGIEVEEETEIETEENLPKFVVLGRPNMGKSTYINALLKEPRMIVDETPGTTIDSIDVTLDHWGRKLILVDTPGVRRRTKMDSDTEFYSLMRTERSISKCDVGLLLVDAPTRLTHQDKRILSMLTTKGKGVVIVANKTDIGIGFNENALDFAKFIPITYMSALKGNNLHEPIKKGFKVWEARKLQVSKRQLRELEKMRARLRITSMVQIGIEPPTFKVKSTKKLTLQDKRFIERTLREQFDFQGTPIKM